MVIINDPFGKSHSNLSLKDIIIYDIFYNNIKFITGCSHLTHLTWDSYILYHYSNYIKSVSYLGTINIRYDKFNNIFIPYNITSNYLESIISIINKQKYIKKIIFNLEIDINSYNHTNIIIINIPNKHIYIFEPWGITIQYKNLQKHYNNIKLKCIKKLFSFINYSIIDLAAKCNISGPQYTDPIIKILDINILKPGMLITHKKYINKNLFIQKIDSKYIYVFEYPQKNTMLIRININDHIYFSTGFDIYNGICDIYCLYFSLLLIVNPNLNEIQILQYLTNNNTNDLQLKIINILQWIIQFYHYQINLIINNKYKFAIKSSTSNFKIFSKNIQYINNYNKLQLNDKKLIDILTQNYCSTININNIYEWLKQKLSSRINVDESFIEYIIKNDNNINNKCYLFLTIKNIYDIENI